MLKQAEIKQLEKRVSVIDGRLRSAFAALADETRMRIFILLLENKEVCVSDLAGILHISVPAASQQLKLLELSGLIKRRRMGKMICYEVERSPMVCSLSKMIKK